MPITKNRGRQSPTEAWVVFNFADAAPSGTFQEAIDLPPNAVVTGGSVVVTTAFNSATSDVITVGDSASATRYLGSTSIAATGRTALLLTGYTTLSTTNRIRVTWTGAGAAPTAGVVRVSVTYIQLGRTAFSQR